MYAASGLGRATLGALAAWPDSPDMNATPAQLYEEYKAYQIAHGNASGAWTQQDPAYIGDYLWRQLHPASLINTGQFGTDVGAIGYDSGTGTAWIQRQSGAIETISTPAEVAAGAPASVPTGGTTVPGMLTTEQAAAGRAVQEELERIRAAGPIPEGFYLDPAVQAEWEAANEGGTWWDRLTGGDEPTEEEGATRAGLPMLLGLGLLGALVASRRRRRR